MSEFRAMGLSECAEFDKKNGAKNNLTAWGKICKARHERVVATTGSEKNTRQDRKRILGK